MIHCYRVHIFLLISIFYIRKSKSPALTFSAGKYEPTQASISLCSCIQKDVVLRHLPAILVARFLHCYYRLMSLTKMAATAICIYKPAFFFPLTGNNGPAV